jgi:hypothetical protein
VLPRSIATGLVALLAGLALPASSAGQAVTVEAAAGHASYPGLRSEAEGPNAQVGVQLDDSAGYWGYAAAGTPIDGFSLPWLALGAGGRPAASVGRYTVGAHLGGHGYAYDERAGDASGLGAILSLLPSLGFTGGTASLDLHLDLYSGVVHHEARTGAADSSRTGHDTGVRATLASAGGFVLYTDARHLRTGDEVHNYAGTRVGYRHGRLGGWASVGGWLGGDGDDPELGAGGNLRVGSATTLHLGFRQEAADPFFESAARRSWSLSLSHRLGRRSAAGPQHGARVRGGSLRLEVPHADAPDALWVAGDFNGWTPAPMSLAGGRWSYEHPVTPGVYRYAFRRSDGSWFVPADGHRRVDDGMGGESGVVVVP